MTEEQILVRYYKYTPADRAFVTKHFPSVFTYILCEVCENKLSFDKDVYLKISTYIDSGLFYRTKEAIDKYVTDIKQASFTELMGNLRVQHMWGYSSMFGHSSLSTICSETCFSLSALHAGYTNECLSITK